MELDGLGVRGGSTFVEVAVVERPVSSLVNWLEPSRIGGRSSDRNTLLFVKIS